MSPWPAVMWQNLSDGFVDDWTADTRSTGPSTCDAHRQLNAAAVRRLSDKDPSLRHDEPWPWRCAAPRIHSLHCNTPPSKQTCPVLGGCMTWSLHATDPCISCAGLQHVVWLLVVGRTATVLVFLCWTCDKHDHTIETGFRVEWLICQRCHTYPVWWCLALCPAFWRWVCGAGSAWENCRASWWAGSMLLRGYHNDITCFHQMLFSLC